MKNKQMKKITILHIIREYKFYLSSLETFNTQYYNNLFIFNRALSTCSESKKIESQGDKIKIVDSNREIIRYIKNSTIDVVYFHSLPPVDWKLVSAIQNKVTIVWWVWGYDIYNGYGLIKPFISLNLYKPLTKSLVVQNNQKHYIKTILTIIKSTYFSLYRSKALRKISYLHTVTETEFNILHSLSGFRHMKRFYAPSNLNFSKPSLDREKQYLMVGNSSSATNNHLDIFESLKTIGFKEKDIIVPLSYGSKRYAEIINKRIMLNKYPFKIKIIRTFLPKEEYESIFNHVSHAIYGVMRQQAMGNIVFCLLHGVKIFLYEDSILYKDFKGRGYIVYSIEKDLTINELRVPLLEEEAIHNYNLWIRNRNENEMKSIAVINEINRER